MIDTNDYKLNRDRLIAEQRVCIALGEFINENAKRCITECETTECRVWIAAFDGVSNWLEHISNDLDVLINELKNAKDEP